MQASDWSFGPIEPIVALVSQLKASLYMPSRNPLDTSAITRYDELKLVQRMRFCLWPAGQMLFVLPYNGRSCEASNDWGQIHILKEPVER